ncbi:MAG: class I SAM-dependent methyltransferase [Candidatus Latescibacterota bacterium]
MADIDPSLARLLAHGVCQAFSAEGQQAARADQVDSPLQPAEEALLARIRPGDRVVDVGCAAGRVAIELARRGHRVLALDVALPLLRCGLPVAGARALAVRFAQAEPARVPLCRGSVDRVVLFRTLCYVPGRSARIAWLRQLGESLRPGGEVLLAQHVLDDATGGYGPVTEDTRRRFPELAERLELGDGFGAEPPEAGGPRYLHFYLQADLQAEIVEAGYALLTWQRCDHVFYGALARG